MADWEFSTQRLSVRPMRVAEAREWHIIRASAPYDPVTRSMDESVAMIAAMQQRAAPDSDGWQQFSILSKDGRMIGDLGIRFSPPFNATAEIGFAVDPAERGKGIGSEAVEGMLRLLFHRGRRRVMAVTDIRNRAAQRVLERNWFRLEGRFIQSWREGDQWFDELSYARLVSD
jgi:RimJ/RimL family protein N-acetyltransferase